MAVLLLANRGFERHRLLRNLDDFLHLAHADAQFLRDFLRARLTAQLLLKLAVHAHDAVNCFHHVHGDADGTRLIGNRAGDSLPNPPRRVGGKLEALGVVELLHCLHQTEVALLNQVEQAHGVLAAPNVLLGNRHDKAQVRFAQAAFRLVADGGVVTFQLLGNFNFRFARQQRNAPDFLQIHAHRVVGRNDISFAQVVVQCGIGHFHGSGGCIRDFRGIYHGHAQTLQLVQHLLQLIGLKKSIAQTIGHFLISDRAFVFCVFVQFVKR